MKNKKKNRGCLRGCGIVCIVIVGFVFILLCIGVIAALFEVPYEEALRLYKNNEYLEANKKIDNLIHKDTINPSLHFLKGRVALELEDTILSKYHIQQAIRLSTSDSLKYEMSKAVFDWKIQKNDTIQAASILLKTLPLFKKDDYHKYVSIHYDVADLFYKEKMSDRSVDVLHELVDSISIKKIDTLSYQKAHYKVYDKLLIFQDSVRALGVLEKLTKELSNSLEAYEKLGNYYRRKSQNKKAISYYKNYLKIDTTNSSVYTNIGKCYRDIKYKKNAITYFKIATQKGNSEACSELRELTAKTRYYTVSICCDGSRSNSTGRGTCSHHGGVCSIEYVPYKDYTMYCN